MPLADVFDDAIAQREAIRQSTQDSEHTITPNTPTPKPSQFNAHFDTDHPIPNDVSDAEPRLRPEQTSKSLSRLSAAPDTPSARTGPPRSLSFAYVIAGSHTPANHAGYFPTLSEQPPDTSVIETDYSFADVDTEFRGALEHPSFLEDRKGKRRQRDRSNSDDGWNINPMKWFQESPKDEKPAMDFPSVTPTAPTHDSPEAERTAAASETDESEDPPLTFLRRPKRGLSVNDPASPSSPAAKTGALRRAFSVPYSRENADTANKENEKTQDKEPTIGNVKWAKLRSLLPHIVHPQENILPGPSMVTSQAVNITDELITGGLSTLMLRLWIERDERGNRRIPILFHRLRIRVSDSLHPMHRHGSVFRIECEYANGAARWVIYRELRDFLSLHAHYTVSNVYNRNVDKMPEFPTTSLPYFKFLKKEGREKGSKVDRADFARLQREALENYLISLIRAVMFHPSSNRLAGFLEISALSLTLAQSGGSQYKAGFLRIEAINNGGGGFGRKSVGWKEKKESRWCAVRESYLVVLCQPGELDVWDVFLLDSDFRIERPKRYYRQGLGNLLHVDKPDAEHPAQQRNHHHDTTNGEKAHSSAHSHLQSHTSTHLDTERKSIMSSIKSHVSKIFHSDNLSANGHTNGHANRQSGDTDDDRSVSSGSVGSSDHSRPPTPMLDPSTNTNPLQGADDGHDQGDADGAVKKIKSGAKKVSGDVSKHIFYVVNSQMRLKLTARNERQMLQFITALEKTASTSHYTGSNRFDSFAPIRLNVAAQWLVDGRDYFWNLSRAMLLAKESIYIHDWWLSPDSNYAKQRLIGLHPNVMVQRSPSHFQTGTFYWAHHEKMCVIDQTIAFMGGLDLCFGRWDTPQHVLTDDTADTDREEIWPGKDYSNPRLSDFYNLNKPEEDMYDRTKVPRMPWHDVAMQIVGQPARDLARHFVQRWNYLLRIKNHSRVMPFLLPPPEFRPGELTQMGLTGTCELQICRSAGPWSLGTPGRIEHSIQNAYLKAIQMSEHFVYIENQFFITSTVVNDVKVENNIGDAIVHRILRAHKDGVPWKCCILIPALPGFTFPVDHSDASAIRIILECQNRTIARGPNSIFSRLRKEGINPDDYIAVFSLRNWAKMRGDVLTTEQVYIHGKVCIVDDRLAIIGSANINERSQRGDRDSELAAVIRDTDMIDSTMAGKPFKVGRFAHTLRVRLMREHLGIDVDALDEEDLMMNDPVKPEHEQEVWDPDKEQAYGEEGGVTHIKKSKQKTRTGALASDVKDSINQAADAGAEATSTKVANVLRAMSLVEKQAGHNVGDDTINEERKDYNREGQKETGFASSVVPTLEEKVVAEQRAGMTHTDGSSITDGTGESFQSRGKSTSNGRAAPSDSSSDLHADDNTLYGAPANAKFPASDDEPPSRSLKSDLDDEEQAAPGARAIIRENLGGKSTRRRPWTVPTTKPHVDPQDFEDPISDSFWKDKWVASAVHNTEIYRKVFHAVPDDLVTTWKQYKEFVAHHDRLKKPTRGSSTGEPVARVPSESGDENTHESQTSDTVDGASQASKDETEDAPPTPSYTVVNEEPPKPRRPAKGSEPFEKWEREEMEKLLRQINGQLA
uniref:Phospholipase n=1 Tax=Psilocybe cubensis TaxID=181762 RepID=A0A8H7XQ51_PSICU